MKSCNIILYLFLVFIISTSLQAQIPQTISYQGILTDTAGIPRPDGVYLITFRLYAAEQGGAPLWFEQNSVNVNKGLFSHNLGSINPLYPTLQFDQPYWLALEISGESELSPRISLTTSPYSFSSMKSRISDTANVALVTIGDTLWSVSGLDIYRLNGNVGIGKFPSEKLDINGTLKTNLLQITNGSSTGGFLFSSNNSGLASWSNQLNIINNNIGIGTNTPQVKLDVNGAITTSELLKANQLQMTLGASSGRFLTSNSQGLANWSSSLFAQSGNLIWIGNIGINDSTPRARLHVKQNSAGWDPIATRNSIFENGGTVSLALRSNETGNMEILFERPVGIAGGFIRFSDSTLIFGRFRYTAINSSSTSFRFYMDITNTRFGIGREPTTNALEVNGDASKSVAGNWIANSDRRIKTDIKDISDAKDLLMKLHPVKFRYSEEWLKRNSSIKDHEYFNFIAQEFKEVFPNSVTGSGEYLDGDPDEILQIDTYNAGIITIKVVQELVKENKKLKEQVDALNIQVQQIKSYMEKMNTIQVREVKND
jgi:hypothetical protein